MSDTTKMINFMGGRRIAMVISIIALIASVSVLAVKGLNFGLDFTGGTLIEVIYEESVPLQQVREDLSAAGYESAIVVNFGSDTDVLVRMPEGMSPTLGEEVLAVLQAGTEAEVELRRIEFVGPQVGEELREQGGLAVLLALVVVLIYVAMRFQIKFSVGAVAALGHDVLITLGVFAIVGWDFDLTVLAAILAVIGYSLNDSIVVADRIRENLRKLRKHDADEIINISLTETLDRTLVTSGTTLLVLLALAFVGGEMIHSFALALLIGIGVGTYSSIYVVASLLMTMNISQDDLIVVEKEGAEIDDLP
ncbi:Protein translocase subunit SecF [Zhongshania aliphaticivorans]|uniref:Protein-export membrane protein SecF n=1 Tax=Zhongshania aliphaticivorans TaxID=1470434 RepID=A0A5S9QML6_9GAMM|nr:protein translocase subunit SecF [Zhongshania aliphaticivorans]CAA0087995.1 Protein translocase subunit SecF [Zhongshania aliphaticivorans]CAA0115765.1 Protein translocase subunit SecF [Zhongshania aliphaticivorans]CAA0120302.1 Protein translocase subunit SecF [Zhongshania aliphaticivorans]